MYYGDADQGFGLSDLGAAEMGVLPGAAALQIMAAQQQQPAAAASSPWFSPESFQQISAGIQQTGQTIADVLRQKAVIQAQIEATRQAARQAGGQMGPVINHVRPPGLRAPWVMPVVLGGLALGGLALFLFMRKKNGSASNNPPRRREHWDDLED